jgi:tetratricopeptide (TPR) repeat protein
MGKRKQKPGLGSGSKKPSSRSDSFFTLTSLSSPTVLVIGAILLVVIAMTVDFDLQRSTPQSSPPGPGPASTAATHNPGAVTVTSSVSTESDSDSPKDLFKAALEAIECTSDNLPHKLWGKMMDEGFDAYTKGDLSTARTHWCSAAGRVYVNMDTTQPRQLAQVTLVLGLSYYDNQNVHNSNDKAKQLWLAGSAIDPAVPDLYENLGNLYYHSGFPHLAIEKYLQALHKGGDRHINLNLGLAYREGGNIADAVRAWQKYKGDSTNDQLLANGLTRIGQFQEAEKILLRYVGDKGHPRSQYPMLAKLVATAIAREASTGDEYNRNHQLAHRYVTKAIANLKLAEREWWSLGSFMVKAQVCPVLESQLDDKVAIDMHFRRLHSQHPGKYDFYPRAFEMPDEVDEVRKIMAASSWETEEHQPRWIAKPMLGSDGRGVHLVDNKELEEYALEKHTGWVLQEYVADPFLVNGIKFDMRCWVIVASVDPLRVYFSRRSYARFASEKYRPDSLSRAVHVTNDGINRKDTDWTEYECGENRVVGERLFSQGGLNYQEIWAKIKIAVARTYSGINNALRVRSSTEDNAQHSDESFIQPRASPCFVLHGLDILVDTKGDVHLIEANGRPGLVPRCREDTALKDDMCHELADIVSAAMDTTNIATFTKTTKKNLAKMKKWAAHQAHRFAGHSSLESAFHNVSIHAADLLERQEAPPTWSRVHFLLEAQHEMTHRGELELVYPNLNVDDEQLELSQLSDSQDKILYVIMERWLHKVAQWQGKKKAKQARKAKL